MTENARIRMKLVALIGVSSALVLLLSLLTVRTILLNQVGRSADEAILDEVDEFIAYVDRAQIGNGEGEQFDSEASLMRGFLARETPETHEMLVSVSEGETMFLDNAQNGMGQRFVEDSPEFETLLEADAASGVQDTPGFGEIRWGKVTTDQEGVFLVLHFTTPAEEEAAGIVWTFTWVSVLALLLVGAGSWSSIGLTQKILSRRRGEHYDDAGHPDSAQDASWNSTPARPLPEETGDPTVPLSDLMRGGPVQRWESASADGASEVSAADGAAGAGATGESEAGVAEPEHRADHDNAEPGAAEPDTADPAQPASLQRTSAASLVLRAQHQLQQLHPDRRFILALEDSEHGAGQTADVLGALAQIEGELDVHAVEAAYRELVDEALQQAEPGTAVVLGAGRAEGSGAEEGSTGELRLSVSAGSPETSSMTVPLTPEQISPDEAEPEGFAAEEPRGRLWQESEHGSGHGQQSAPAVHAVVYPMR